MRKEATLRVLPGVSRSMEFRKDFGKPSKTASKYSTGKSPGSQLPGHCAPPAPTPHFQPRRLHAPAPTEQQRCSRLVPRQFHFCSHTEAPAGGCGRLVYCAGLEWSTDIGEGIPRDRPNCGPRCVPDQAEPPRPCCCPCLVECTLALQGDQAMAKHASAFEQGNVATSCFGLSAFPVKAVPCRQPRNQDRGIQ
jgi:hypothetical protein